jgi:hypothetical protein
MDLMLPALAGLICEVVTMGQHCMTDVGNVLGLTESCSSRIVKAAND